MARLSTFVLQKRGQNAKLRLSYTINVLKRKVASLRWSCIAWNIISFTPLVSVIAEVCGKFICSLRYFDSWLLLHRTQHLYSCATKARKILGKMLQSFPCPTSLVRVMPPVRLFFSSCIEWCAQPSFSCHEKRKREPSSHLLQSSRCHNFQCILWNTFRIGKNLSIQN